MDSLDAICEIFGLDKLDNKPMIKAYPGRVGIKNSYQILALLTIIMNLIVLDVGSEFLVNLLSLIYPFHESLHLIKSSPNIQEYA